MDDRTRLDGASLILEGCMTILLGGQGKADSVKTCELVGSAACASLRRWCCAAKMADAEINQTRSSHILFYRSQVGKEYIDVQFSYTRDTG